MDRIRSDISERKNNYCIPINVTKYSLAKNDEKLRSAINNTNYVIADGVPITWLCKRAGIKGVTRVTGIDLAEALCFEAEKKGRKLFFLSTREEIGKKAIDNLLVKHPNLNIAGFQDGFFEEKDVPSILSRINTSETDILFLGLGLPQKEYFVADNLDALNIGFCITVGGALDIWANVKKRAPKFVQAIGMEWLYRSLSNVKKVTQLFAHDGVFVRDFVFYRGSS